jgi:prepilin-type N-terminal cleavage/methylation domain-containing protein
MKPFAKRFAHSRAPCSGRHMGSCVPGPSRSHKAGFTLVELLVSMLVATILMASIYQVLATNQRVSLVQSEQLIGHQTVRAGLDILSQELREVAAQGGDLVSIESSSVEFRALRAFGLACQVVPNTPPTLSVAPLGRPFEAGDSVYVFAEGNPGRADDDGWFAVAVQSAAGSASCGTDGVPAQTLVLTGPGNPLDVARIRTGAPIRAWQRVEYGLEVDGGESYLIRTQEGTSARLVGPLEPGVGLEFEYLDAAGNVTVVGTEVTRIRITLRTLSEVRTEQGRQVADALTTTVFLRN